MKKITLLIALSFLSLHYIWAQNIVAIEYTVDQDNGFGDGTVVNVTPSQDGNFNFSVNTAGLSKGYHTLFLRTLDSDGKWSHTSNRTIEILDDVSANLVESVEFFNNTLGDFGDGEAVTFSTPRADGSFVVNFPYNEVTPGTVTLYARVKDTRQLWSFPAWKEVTLRLQDDPPPPNSIAEINGNAFNVYPNPASNELTLVFEQQPENRISVSLIDVSGKVQQTWETNAAKTQLHLSQPSGNYFMKIRSGDKEVTQMITINK